MPPYHRTIYPPLVNCRFWPADCQRGCQRTCTSCWDFRETEKLLAATHSSCPRRAEPTTSETMEVHRLAMRLRELGVDRIRLDTDGAPVVSFAA